MMEEPLLKVENLKVHFPIYRGLFRKEIGSVKAVNGVDLTVNKKEVHAVVGESGSGKTTLGRACIRLVRPTEGTIRFKGVSLEHLTQKEIKPFRKNIQIIFQDPFSSLNPRRRVVDSLGEGLLLHGLVHSEKQMREKVASILESVGLSPDVMDRYPHQFSGGQQQRICIARAVILEPELIICDEAVSALDLSVQAQILNLLSRLQEEFDLSYLFISHDLSVVKHFSDRLTVMYLGKVMETGNAAKILSHPKHPYTQLLLASIPKTYPGEKKERILLKGEIPSAINPPSGCPFRTRCPYAQRLCAEPPPRKSMDGEEQVYYCILD
jgi:oligopeptide/dipeptide ABC transporter ATP-binding protein